MVFKLNTLQFIMVRKNRSINGVLPDHQGEKYRFGTGRTAPSYNNDRAKMSIRDMRRIFLLKTRSWVIVRRVLYRKIVRRLWQLSSFVYTVA